VDPTDAVEPGLVELVAHVAFEEGAARHLVALGEAKHLPAKPGQLAVVGVERVDQRLDLAAVELDAFDLGGQLLAQLLVLLLLRRRLRRLPRSPRSARRSGPCSASPRGRGSRAAASGPRSGHWTSR